MQCFLGVFLRHFRNMLFSRGRKMSVLHFNRIIERGRRGKIMALFSYHLIKRAGFNRVGEGK